MTPVPSKRLFWCVAALVPAAAIAGALPELWPLCLLALCGMLGVATYDLWQSYRTIRVLTASAPAVSRFTKDRRGSVELELTCEPGPAQRVRLALALSGSFVSEKAECYVDIAEGAKRALLSWVCQGSRRGRFAAGPVCFEHDSPFGFWQFRRQQPLPVELRVYPNLFSERKQLAALFLNQGSAGVQLRRTVGRGREFERLREYQPGDSFDEVHWKGTAKQGRPITKVFQVERTQEIYVIIDSSRLSGRPVKLDGRVVTTLERQLTAALVLLLAAGRQGDRFGLITHDARVQTFLRARNGAGHYGACREAVHALEPSDTSPDFAELFSLLRTRLQRRSLLIFLTDLGDPLLAEEFVKNVRVLSRHHLVLVNQMRSPGVEPLFSEPVETDEAVYSRLAGHLQWKESRDIAGRLHPLGVTATSMANETLATELVQQYLQVKRRQLL